MYNVSSIYVSTTFSEMVTDLWYIFLHSLCVFCSVHVLSSCHSTVVHIMVFFLMVQVSLVIQGVSSDMCLHRIYKYI